MSQIMKKPRYNATHPVYAVYPLMQVTSSKSHYLRILKAARDYATFLGTNTRNCYTHAYCNGSSIQYRIDGYWNCTMHPWATQVCIVRKKSSNK